MREITAEALARLALFAVANLLLLAFVFTFNDWAGIRSDAADPNRAAGVFLGRGVSPRELAFVSLGLLCASLMVFAWLPLPTFLLAIVLAALGGVYSHPQINGKGIPIVSSLIHLVGGALHFLQGYTLFGRPDGRAMLLALCFALLFVAGHLAQEVRDHVADRDSGLRTNAVWFGAEPVFLASLAVFTAADGLILLLCLGGVVPTRVGWVTAALYPLQLTWWLRTARTGICFTSVASLQTVYRLRYGVIGICMATTWLVSMTAGR
jgi:4-hydroxybenzoate polyprenyltransferase